MIFGPKHLIKFRTCANNAGMSKSTPLQCVAAEFSFNPPEWRLHIRAPVKAPKSHTHQTVPNICRQWISNPNKIPHLNHIYSKSGM